MIHLRSIVYRKPLERTSSAFPFNLPVIQNLDEINFSSPVTILVGENGSGKSTLLEALACAAGSITVESQSVNTDESLETVRRLSKHFRLTWNKRTRRGFFLRAEDFFGYARRMSQIRAEMQAEIEAIEKNYEDRSEQAKALANMPYARELGGIQRRYGEGLDSQSHGESFLALFQSRFVPGGL